MHGPFRPSPDLLILPREIASMYLAGVKLGLERLDASIDRETFRADLERIDGKELKSAVGRKPMDHGRMRVEHVFGTMIQMGGMFVRGIGLKRMHAWPTMKALTYNLKRLEALNRMGKVFIGGMGVPGCPGTCRTDCNEGP